MTILFGYMRCSGNGQIEGDTWHRQSEAIQNFIKAHFAGDPSVKIEYGREAAVSGTIEAEERPLFAQLLHAWARGDNKPDAIIVERLDRFARDLMVQECAIRDLKRLGIKVYSCDHGLTDMANDTDDPSRTLIRQVFGAISQYDKSVTVKKLALARKRIRDSGKKCEGRKYFGEVDENDRALRMQVIALRGAGISFRNIAGVLRSEGSRRSNGEWVTLDLCKHIWYHYIRGTDETE